MDTTEYIKNCIEQIKADYIDTEGHFEFGMFNSKGLVAMNIMIFPEEQTITTYAIMGYWVPEEKRETVLDLIDTNKRLYPVGRLDYDTTGALLLTNDGEFANQIIHPRYHLPKTYNLTINGILNGKDMKALKEGILLDDGYRTQPSRFKITEKDEEKNQCSFDLTIYEGKNRQIKRMMEALGYEVRRLHRKQIAFLGCSDLSQGEYRILKPHEVKMLRALALKGRITNLR